MKVTVTQVTRRDKPAGRWVYPKPIGNITPRPYRERDERNVKTRVYVGPEGETVLENFLGGRWTRPHKHPQVREAVHRTLTLFGARPGTTFHWSQKAGCSCGCSPGFIADVRLGFDVYITYEVEED